MGCQYLAAATHMTGGAGGGPIVHPCGPGAAGGIEVVLILIGVIDRAMLGLFIDLYLGMIRSRMTLVASLGFSGFGHREAVTIVTGDEDLLDEKRVKSVPVSGVIAKPLEPDILFSTIRRIPASMRCLFFRVILNEARQPRPNPGARGSVLRSQCSGYDGSFLRLPDHRGVDGVHR